MPFSVHYDFETTTGSAVFFDAEMYVISYCMVVTFHPEVNIPRLVIFRCYDQTLDELQSITHFQILDFNFFDDKDNFNKVTLKQLQDASFSVYNREKKHCHKNLLSTV